MRVKKIVLSCAHSAGIGFFKEMLLISDCLLRIRCISAVRNREQSSSCLQVMVPSQTCHRSADWRCYHRCTHLTISLGIPGPSGRPDGAGASPADPALHSLRRNQTKNVFSFEVLVSTTVTCPTGLSPHHLHPCSLPALSHQGPAWKDLPSPSFAEAALCCVE